VVLSGLAAGIGCSGDDPRGEPNQPPAIDQLTANPEQPHPGEELTLSVEVDDLDNAADDAGSSPDTGRPEASDVGGGPTGDSGDDTSGLPANLEASWRVSNSAWSLASEQGATTGLTPPDKYQTRTDVEVTVTDSDGASASRSMSLTIGENRAPRIESALADPSRLEPNETSALEAEATDAYGDDLTYTWSAPDDWTIEEPSGSETELTAPDRNDVRGRIQLEVSDGYGGKDSTTVQVRTTDNLPPSISSMVASPPQLDPGRQATVSVEATDPDGDELSYEWSGPDGWSVSAEGAEATITAPDRHNATGTISVTVTDTRGNEVSGRVLISTGSNVGPAVHSLTATPQQVGRGETLEAAVDATDRDGGELSYEWSVADGDWTLNPGGETAQLTAPATPGVSTSLRVTVSDDDGQSVTSSIVVSTAPNEAPSLGSLTASPSRVDPAGTSNLTATATDPDGDDLTYTWNAPSAWSLTDNGDTATVTAPDEYGATATMSVTVEDDFGGQTSGTATVSTVRNQRPTISDVTASPSVVSRQQTSTLSVTASDPNGDSLSYVWSTPKDWTVDGSGDTVTVTAPDQYDARGEFEVTVEDGHGGATTRSVVVRTESNEPPTVSSLTAQPLYLSPGETSSVTANSSDPNGDSLTHTWNVPGDWTQSGSGDQIQVEAPNRTNASATVSVTVEDGHGGSSSEAVVLQTVRNQPPVIDSLTATPTTVDPTESATLTASASDPDGQSLSYSWNIPSGWSGSSNTSDLTVTPPREYGKTYTFEVEVSDGFDTVTEQVQISTVSNASPTIDNLAASPNPVEAGNTTTVSVTGSDTYGDSLSYSWSIDNKDWSRSASGSSLQLDSPNKNSSVTVTVTVSDGFGGTASASITVESKVALYSFSSHTFSNCGETGRTGPTVSKCRSAYSTGWDDNSNYYSMSTQGIQEWTVPETATYRIEAAGAGYNLNDSEPEQQGAIIRAEFDLDRGDVLDILVGQMAASFESGSGGTFVEYQGSPLIVAGGSGGQSSYIDPDVKASTGTAGRDGNVGPGGTGGSGGTQSCGNIYGGGAGGGYSGDGIINGSDYGCPGDGFVNGGKGGSLSCGNSVDTVGGFGGGGAGYKNDEPAGGGGYSGGGGGGADNGCGTSPTRYGGGGGSFVSGSGTSVDKSVGHRGHGYLKIEKLP
jgi:predicted secreted protein